MTDDFEQPAFSDDERREILRRARETAARSDEQEILPRDLDQRFGDDERRSILHRAHALLVGHKTPVVHDDRAWSEDEKAEILASARATVRRDAATGLITKVKMDAFEAEAPEAPEARQPRQRYQRRRRAYFDDPIETTGWPEPPSEQDNLDTRFEDLITARVEKLFAGQHEYILGLLAQVLANSVERDGVVEIAIEKERRHNRREVRKLQAQIENLQHALDELRDAVASERSRALTLPPLLPARSSDLN